MMANQVDDKPSLPSHLVRCEYLEATGTQYIDLGYPLGYNNKVVADIEPKSSTTTSAVILNITNASKSIQLNVQNGACQQKFGKVVNTYKLYREGRYSVSIDNKGVSAKDDFYKWNTSVSDFTTEGNVFLFGTKNVYQYNGKLYSCQIYENDILIHNYIPCYNTENYRPCMYDVTTGIELYNAGTSEFIYHIADKPIPYLAFEALEDDLQVSITKSATQYSLDRVNWIDLPAEELTQPVSKGEKVWFRANITPTTTGIGTFSCTKKCNLEGTPMSLLYGDRAGDYPYIPNYAFMELFNNNIKIISATDDFITFSSIGVNACKNMFKQCSNFVSSLTNFFTTIYSNCYNSMYYGTKIEEIILPARKSSGGCYRNIATNCYSLKKAIICIENLTETCLYGAFTNCNKLNHITLLILSPPNSVNNSMGYWVSGVSPTGTIVLNKNIEWNPDDYRGVNGIPAGWEVKYCDPDNLDDVRDYREIDQPW